VDIQIEKDHLDYQLLFRSCMHRSNRVYREQELVSFLDQVLELGQEVLVQ